MTNRKSNFLFVAQDNDILIVYDLSRGHHMFKYKSLSLYILLLPALFVACDHGLQPVDGEKLQTSKIGGTIYYKNWEASGTIEDLRLIVFPDYPPGDIRTEVLSQRAIVFPALGEAGLPFPDIDSTNFLLEVDPGIYEYLVVAQRYGPDAFNDWRAVGQYDTLAGDQSPTSITVQSGDLIDQLHITVDFDSLPPQPF